MRIFINFLFPIVFSLNVFADVAEDNLLSPPTPDTIDQYNITMSCEPEYIHDNEGRVKAETICLKLSAERKLGENGFTIVKIANSTVFNSNGSPAEIYGLIKNSKIENMEKFIKATAQADFIRAVPLYDSKVCSTQFVASQAKLHAIAYEKCDEAVKEKKFDSNGLSWTKQVAE